MNNELINAVKAGRVWTDRFTRFEYRKAFEEYCDLYCKLFKEEIEKYASSDIFAEEFISELYKSISEEKFFNRSACRADSKMTIVEYLCPMLEKTGRKDCADEICLVWGRHFKGEQIQSSSYETLLNGFRNAILGIDLEGKHNCK